MEGIVGRRQGNNKGRGKEIKRYKGRDERKEVRKTGKQVRGWRGKLKDQGKGEQDRWIEEEEEKKERKTREGRCDGKNK